MALLPRRVTLPPPLSPLIPLWSSCYFGSLVVWGITVTSPSFLRTCFAVSLSICTVGNPFLLSMGRSESRVIVEVVALVALLPGTALSPWITVRYGRHHRKVLISFRSSLPSTSTWLGTSLPPLTWSSPRGLVTAKTPPIRLGCPGVRPPSTSPPLRTRGLPRPNPPHVPPSAPRSGLYGPGTITLGGGCVRWCLQLGIVKGLRGGWAFSGACFTDLGFFGFSHF